MSPPMSQHSVAETKNRLPALLHEVELGSAVEITRRGKTVAVLLSVAEYQRLLYRKPDLWEKIRQFRATHHLEDQELHLAFEGLRDAAPGRDFSW